MIHQSELALTYQALLPKECASVLIVEGCAGPEDMRVLDALYVSEANKETVESLPFEALECGLEWALVIPHDSAESLEIVARETGRTAHAGAWISLSAFSPTTAVSVCDMGAPPATVLVPAPASDPQR